MNIDLSIAMVHPLLRNDDDDDVWNGGLRVLWTRWDSRRGTKYQDHGEIKWIKQNSYRLIPTQYSQSTVHPNRNLRYRADHTSFRFDVRCVRIAFESGFERHDLGGCEEGECGGRVKGGKVGFGVAEVWVWEVGEEAGVGR